MRVLFDHQIFSYQVTGGISRYFSELYRWLPRFGWETRLGFRRTINRYLLDSSNSTTQTFAPLGPRRVFKGQAHLVAAWNRLGAVRHLQRNDYQLFHPTYYDPYFLDRLGSRPFVLTIHDMVHELFPEAVSDASVVQARKRLLAEKAVLVLAVSEYTRQDALRLLGLPPTKVVTVHHGTSLSPDQVQPESVATPERFLLYVGGRGTYKNALVVWEVFAALRARWPDLWLVHAGGGDFSSDETATLSKLGITSRVVQLRVSDPGLATLYQRAIGLVYPSRYEGFGLPLVEAMAWNCPVLAAKASCLPEIGGDAADFIESENEEAWKNGIENLLNSQGRADPKMTVARRDRAAVYSWAACAAKTAQAYQRVWAATNSSSAPIPDTLSTTKGNNQ